MVFFQFLNLHCRVKPRLPYSILSLQVLFPKPAAFQEGSKTSYPRGTVLLSTRMRYGVVSYENTDVATWKDGGKWRLSDVFAGLLREEWKSTPVARLELVTDDNRVATVKVTDETSTSDETSERRNNCSIS